MICERCNLPNKKILFQSVFNLQHICVDCMELEKEHELYNEAVLAFSKSIESGEYDFEGIGLPKNYIKDNKK